MPVLAMLELDGDPEALLAASGELERRLGTPDGLLVRMLARTDTGVVLFQLWATPEARARNAENPHHREALEASGMMAAVTGSRSRAFDDVGLQVFAPE